MRYKLSLNWFEERPYTCRWNVFISLLNASLPENISITWPRSTGTPLIMKSYQTFIHSGHVYVKLAYYCRFITICSAYLSHFEAGPTAWKIHIVYILIKSTLFICCLCFDKVEQVRRLRIFKCVPIVKYIFLFSLSLTLWTPTAVRQLFKRHFKHYLQGLYFVCIIYTRHYTTSFKKTDWLYWAE